MKYLTFSAIVLLVAAISYGLGRRSGLTHRAPAVNEQNGTSQKSLPNASVSKAYRELQPWPAARALETADPAAPFAQNLTAAQRGYAAAELNLDDALKQIDSLPVPERLGFITGIFSFVGKNRTPADALKVYQQVPEAHRPNALRALVAEWIQSKSPLDENMRYLKREGTLAMSGSRLGLESELTAMLATCQFDAELTSAWLDAFSQHSSRSEIFSILAGRVAYFDPESMLARTATWTSWEKERVTKSFFSQWAYGAPEDAWNWYQSRRGQFEQDHSPSILQPWAAKDPDAVQRLLQRTDDPHQRRTAIAAIGKVLAEKNTDQAVAWADTIADAQERALAHQAVYDGAPRGIGAVLDFEKGFPRLRGVVPGSPLDGSGAQAGDQIIEVRESNGAAHPLYGRDLQTAVNLIRGEAGTQMTLRVLRHNEASGQMEEHLIPVTRGQLYLDEKLIPKPPPG